MKKNNSAFLVISLTLATLIGCTKDENDIQPTTEYGTPVAFGGDSLRSFITVDGSGQLTAIGLEIGENALAGLPTDTSGGPEYSFAAALPVNTPASIGIDHIEVDWNPYGHEPLGVYNVPHFDFHFYYVDESVQGSVIPGLDTMTVAPQFIPQDYISGIFAVPNMGVHYVDSTASEYHGVPFSATFIYGFYHGNFMFLEPMVTKAFLETHPDFSAQVKQPQAFQNPGYYPTSYDVKYDGDKHVYRISLTGLTQH